MSNAEKFLLTGLIVAGASYVAYDTYDEKWFVTRNEVGAIDGVEFGPPTSVAESETTLPANVSTRLELSRELIKIAKTDDWCSSEKLSYDQVNYPYVQIPERATPLRPGEEYSADLCIDSQSVTVGTDNNVDLYMGTHNPVIPQIDGNPSIFLTYNESQALGKCIDAKEEMRSKVQEDIDMLLGSRAARYQITIHVDKRNLDHPCDDSFGS